MRERAKVVLVVTVAVAALAAGCSSRHLDLTQASTQMQFGVKMARANLWREALFRFERAVEIDPNDAEALNNLAVAYEGIGEFDKARDAYTRALRADKSNQHIQKNYSRFVEFYSRNKKRERKLEEVSRSEEAKAKEPAAGEAEPPTPVEVSRPEEPPKPGEIPVSELPPDPTPPVPPQPPPSPPPGGGGA